jgi:vancomycin permeability regulator SanA
MPFTYLLYHNYTFVFKRLHTYFCSAVQMFIICCLITNAYITICIQLQNETNIKQLPKCLQKGGQAALPIVSRGLGIT